MRVSGLPLTLLVVALLVLACGKSKVEKPTSDAGLCWTPVAVIDNEGTERAPLRTRLHEIMRAKGIEAGAAGSRGVTISVPATQAAEARCLLSAAAQKEHLEVDIVAPRDGGCPEPVDTPPTCR